MSVLGGFTEPALALVRQYGHLAVFLFTFLETSMLFPFLPSEVVVPFAAALLVDSSGTVALFVVVTTAGATLGSLTAYSLFGSGGARAASRYADYVRVSTDEIRRSQRWFRQWGEGTVFWGRLLPFLRSVISVPAGFAGMDRGRFLGYSAGGSLLFYLGVALLVYYGKRHSVYAVAVEALGTLLARVAGAVTARPALGGLVVALALVGASLAVRAWNE